MTNIIKFPVTEEDNHGYKLVDGKVSSVYFKLNDIAIEIPLAGTVTIYDHVEGMGLGISQDDLKHLMIMWLSMVDPEVINYDR